MLRVPMGSFAVAAMLAVAILLATSGSQGMGTGSDSSLLALATPAPCPAPTPAPGEPTPTPPPTPGPTEFDVLLTFTFFDNTGQAASGFHVCFDRGIGGAQLEVNAPGCQFPTVSHTLRSTDVDIVWPSACVDPGESIRMQIGAPGSALVSCSFWTVFGSPLNACPGDNQSSPTVTPTPSGPAVLFVDKVDLQDPASVDQPVEYRVLVANTGANTAVAVQLEDAATLDGTTPPSVVQLDPRCQHGVSVPEQIYFTCSLGNILAGSSTTVVFVLSASVPGAIFNCASATAANADASVDCENTAITGTSPTPTPTPTATGTATPTVCPAPSLTPTPTALPPSGTPGPGITQAQFCNANEQSASDLHFRIPNIAPAVTFQENAPGCPEPAITVNAESSYSAVDAVWPSACVDPGESVVFSITCQFYCPPTCYSWTLSGSALPVSASPCPTPTPTATPTPTPGTPTPTPTGIVCPALATPYPTMWFDSQTFVNQTGQSASDLHARWNGPITLCQLQNAPGCPEPSGSGFPELNLDWGTPCVDNGESVSITYASEPPATLICAEWTLFGVPVGPAISGKPPCSTPTPTATVTPTPTPTATPTATPNPTPAGLFHDAAIKRIGSPHSVRLAPAVPDTTGRLTIVVAASHSNHADDVGVYLALLPPGGLPNPGACSPATVLNLGVFSLLPAGKVTIQVDPPWTCAHPAAVDGLNWTLKAIADVHGDDFGACGTLTQAFDAGCSLALADDDATDANNTRTRARPIVVSLAP